MALPLPPGGKVLVFLPHCHATPDETLACLRFPAAAANAANAADAAADDAKSADAAAESADATGAMPRAAASISVVQLPCCGYVWHDTLLGQG